MSSSRETISSWERWVEVSNHKGAYEVCGSINCLDVLAVYWDECCTTSVV